MKKLITALVLFAMLFSANTAEARFLGLKLIKIQIVERIRFKINGGHVPKKIQKRIEENNHVCCINDNGPL